MRKMIVPAVCALAVAAVPASASARVASDASWLQSAIQADMAQVQAGQVGESKASTKTAMALAKAMVADHAALLSRAEKVANAAKITIPTSTTTAFATELATLKTESGQTFTVQFVKDEISGYEQFIAQTETEINSGSSAAVKAVARYYLPIFQDHLKLADDAAATLHIATS